MTTKALILSVTVSFLLMLQACSSPSIPGGEAKYPTGAQRSSTSGDIYAEPESIFGPDGLKLLGGGKDKAGEHVITVNSFLWRASLDTVSFMPIASVDPFGGAILTDWYSAPETPNERYKMNIFVLGSQLRSDAIKVSVFKERLSGRDWKAMKVDESMARTIEDTILTRARELRIAKVNND